MTVLTSLGWGTPTDSYALVSDIIMIPYTSYSCLYKLMFSITKKRETNEKPKHWFFLLAIPWTEYEVFFSICLTSPITKISELRSNQLVFEILKGCFSEGKKNHNQTVASFKIFYFLVYTHLKEWERNSSFP